MNIGHVAPCTCIRNHVQTKPEIDTMIVHAVVVVKPVAVMAAGADFPKQICLSLSTVAIWHGRKTFTSQCQEVTTVNSERTDLSPFIKPNHPAYGQSLACHGLPPTSLSNSRPLESRQRSSRLCSWVTGGVKHASHLETSPAGSMSWC